MLDKPKLSGNLVSPAPASLAEWLAYIRPDFVQGHTSIITGAKKLIEAKAALKGSELSFTVLVEDGLGLDLDKAERLMVIARHPVLSDSAHARILPLRWTVLHTLSRIAPEALERLIANRKICPELKRKDAERLVEQAHGQNSPNRNGSETPIERRTGNSDRVEDCGNGVGEDFGDGRDGCDTQDDRAGRDELHDDDDEIHGRQTQPVPVPRDDIGSDSRCEIDRKLARLEELEREKRQWEIQRCGHESEIQELRARLDETNVPHQRRIFRQALLSLQNAEASGINEKEKRSLRASATTDLVEFVRSAARDGLSLNRFDIYYRPGVH